MMYSGCHFLETLVNLGLPNDYVLVADIVRGSLGVSTCIRGFALDFLDKLGPLTSTLAYSMPELFVLYSRYFHIVYIELLCQKPSYDPVQRDGPRSWSFLASAGLGYLEDSTTLLVPLLLGLVFESKSLD